jgi:hypothetical protein
MAMGMDDGIKYSIIDVFVHPSTPNCLKIGPNVPLQAPAPNAPKPTETSFNGFPFSSVCARAPFESNRIELRQIRFDRFESNLCRGSIRSELANIRRIFDVRRTPVT